MQKCFICSLLNINSLATISKHIDCTYNQIKDIIESVCVKTYLFGWIKIFEDKIVKKNTKHKNNGYKSVCNMHASVKYIETYPDKEPYVKHEINLDDEKEEILDFIYKKFKKEELTNDLLKSKLLKRWNILK